MRAWTVVLGLLLAGDLAAEPEKLPPVILMEQALSATLARPTENDPFVVFTDNKTQYFVQFACDNEVLYVDVPLIDRSKEEQERLAILFRSIGVDRPVSKLARDVKTKKSLTIRTYQADFGRDVKKAARFGIRVFREVYLLKQLSLSLETD